jgi:hypothetical protein
MVRRVVSILVLCFVAAVSAAEDANALWARKVQPLLDVQCTKCHGLIERKGGLLLDRPEEIFKGGNDGAVVVPGKPEESRLYKYLAADSDPHMPPKKQLSDEQREAVKEWIVALGVKGATTAKSEKNVFKQRKFGSVTEGIDVLLAESWKEEKVRPAAAVDDRAWARRVYLDLAGRIPTAVELEEFLKARGKNKRAELVDRLLASDEYAVRMRELWDVLLMGRPKRGNGEDRRKENGWWAFLETTFKTNRPWNDVVREILVARPERPEDKGATWFLYERRNDHQAIAEAVSPVVYGTRIDCAQCHDHPLAREIKQAHYWGLVAAFNRSKNAERGGGNDVTESAVGGFVNFTNLKKESQPAVMAMLTGATIEEKRPASGEKESDNDDLYVDPKAKVKVPKFSRRAEFAKAATEGNPLLARAFVNRMWAALLGRGLVHPADEINARNAPSHPELLEWLAKDFGANNHDVRRLVRGIVLSRVYGLGPTREAPEKFAGALERPLSAEQIARSWRVAAGLPANDDALRKKVIAAMPAVMPKEYNATFQQAQFLTYSPAVVELLKDSAAKDGTLGKLVAMKTADERVRGAFVAIYGRAPDKEELAAAKEFLKDRSAVEDGLRDLVWALMTSAEFLTMP